MLMMKKLKRTDRKGFYLEFSSGHKYSVIDLSTSPIVVDRTLAGEAPFRSIGLHYDKMGGRFEAILLPETNDGEWGDPIRNHSFEAVIEDVKGLEEELKEAN